MNLPVLSRQALQLLQDLIAIPAYSREEGRRADYLENYLRNYGCQVERLGHNLIVRHRPEAPYRILLNSHLDTIKPSTSWRRDPHRPVIEDGKLYGLGANDAGGPLVTLLVSFLTLIKSNYPHQLILVISAEEEISGAGGVSAIRDQIGRVDAGIVGEPTSLQVAVAEKGLMVIDAYADGVAGHAARDEGTNAIYLALEDIQKIRNYTFAEISPWLGKVKMTVTQIQAGTQHNVVPDLCSYVIDVRTTEKYQNQHIFNELVQLCHARIQARSFRLQSSGIALEHPLVKASQSLNLGLYGSPTLSDQALWQWPTIKLGCGQSARSHVADEYLYLTDIEQGIEIYLKLLLELDHLIS